MAEIHTLDLKYLGTPEAVAAYVVLGSRGAVLIETGPANTVEALARGLKSLDLTPADIQHALVTHIHFDHAGASGWLAQHGTHIHVHSFGAKHLIDPSKLMASARRIHGEHLEERWGMLEPVPAAQVHEVHGGDVIDSCGLQFGAIETPGHARHHHAFVLDDGGERIAFTGDAAACFVHETPDFISLPTPPPEFDYEAWQQTLDRLEAERFDAIYPTHFGRVDDPPAHYARVRGALTQHTFLVRDLLDAGLDEDELLERYRSWFVAQAKSAHLPEVKVAFYAKHTLPRMNVMGIARYWSKRTERSARNVARADTLPT